MAGGMLRTAGYWGPGSREGKGGAESWKPGRKKNNPSRLWRKRIREETR